MRCENCGNDMTLEDRGGYSVWVCEICEKEEELEE